MNIAHWSFLSFFTSFELVCEYDSAFFVCELDLILQVDFPE